MIETRPQDLNKMSRKLIADRHWSKLFAKENKIYSIWLNNYGLSIVKKITYQFNEEGD